MYDYGVIGVLYASLNIAVLASVRYWLYRDRLRVPAVLMYPILLAICMAGGVIWLLTGGIPGMTFDAYRVALALLMFTLSCVMIKAPIAEHAFSYAFTLAFDAAAETTAFYIQLNFFANSPVYVYPVITGLIVVAALIPGARCLRNMIAHISEMGSDKIWRWLDLACFSFLFMNLMVTMPHPVEMGLYYPIGRYLMLLGMAGIYKATVRMMDVMRVSAAAKAELSMAQRQVAMQQSYYDRMIAQMDDVRRMKHELRHHRVALSALIKSGDTAALSAYTDAYSAYEDVIPVTGNLAADSILLHYMDEAKSLCAHIETNLALGRNTPLTDPDLCVILSNLLENAVDAQRYLAPERRYICVRAQGDENSLTLAVDNRFDGTLKLDENDAYVSRKEGEGHGLGISSVRVVCEKYGGILQFETEGDIFMAGVVIGV